MKVLVTAASSELGLAVCAALVELGIEVVAWDEGSPPEPAAEVEPGAGAVLLVPPASGGVGIEWSERRAAIETEVLGTMRRLEALGRAGIAHLVLAATAEEDGTFPSAIALAREDHARAFAEETGARVCFLRLPLQARAGAVATQRAARAIAKATQQRLVGVFSLDAIVDATGGPLNDGS